MEKVKRQSLKRSFMKAVAITMLIVFLCSTFAIFVCYRLQRRILPDSNEVWLTQLTVLMDATTHIQNQDLSFQIKFDRQDELGRLCAAFEKMRQTLYENNRQQRGAIIVSEIPQE